jgi:phosphoribosylformylglycinamidine cyclo-ligase
MTARWPDKTLISNEKIKAGDLIVGLTSFGLSNYETSYNSGIGSNGLTSARHDVLDKYYATKYPETYEPSLDEKVIYIGTHKLTDSISISSKFYNGSETIGSLLLSPTRTYAPFLKMLLEEQFQNVHGLIHCSGGGQTKCMKYLHKNFRIIKDNLFEAPEIFKIIQQSSGSDNSEMYQVFNMGHRLEVFTDEQSADAIIKLAASFNIDAQVVGRVEEYEKKELILQVGNEKIVY